MRRSAASRAARARTSSHPPSIPLHVPRAHRKSLKIILNPHIDPLCLLTAATFAPVLRSSIALLHIACVIPHTDPPPELLYHYHSHQHAVRPRHSSVDRLCISCAESVRQACTTRLRKHLEQWRKLPDRHRQHLREHGLRDDEGEPPPPSNLPSSHRKQ